MAEAIPALEIRNLHKRYGDLEVLKGISLTARDGDVISILGSSGSGKSTFLRCLNGLEELDSGSVSIDGVDLANPKTDVNAYRREVGMVFQHFSLFETLSVAENIALALKAFHEVALFEDLKRLPDDQASLETASLPDLTDDSSAASDSSDLSDIGALGSFLEI